MGPFKNCAPVLTFFPLHFISAEKTSFLCKFTSLVAYRISQRSLVVRNTNVWTEHVFLKHRGSWLCVLTHFCLGSIISWLGNKGKAEYHQTTRSTYRYNSSCRFLHFYMKEKIAIYYCMVIMHPREITSSGKGAWQETKMSRGNRHAQNL